MASFFFTLLISSCKKESAAPKKTQQTTATSLTVDDTAVGNLTHNSFNNSGNFGVICYGNGGAPEVQISFYGSQTPTTGTYIIASGTPTIGKCSFVFSNSNGTSTATSGSVYVEWHGGTSNVVSFTNVYVGGSGGTHRVSGTITY